MQTDQLELNGSTIEAPAGPEGSSKEEYFCQDAVIRIMRAMSSTIDARDAYTCGHSQRVGQTAAEIGTWIGLNAEECEQLYLTGLLHDVGKIGVPDRVLLKSGRLTDDEFELIKMHPEIGYRIIAPIAELSFTLPGILHHHERIDGRGYPHGLRGEKIHRSARILAVADAYDAMTSSRTYRSAMTPERARAILEEGAGTQWDHEIVCAFVALKDASQPAGIAPSPLLDDQFLSESDSIFDDDEAARSQWLNDSMMVLDCQINSPFQATEIVSDPE